MKQPFRKRALKEAKTAGRRFFKGPRLAAFGKNLPFIILFAVCLAAQLLFFLYPLEQLQKTARKAIPAKAQRWLKLRGSSTLSLMNVDLLDGRKRIRKVQKGRRLYIEIYDSSDGRLSLIDRIQLKGRHNGYFEYSGKSMGKNFNKTVSLSVLDQDGDGLKEIVAPAFDRRFMPYVNHIRYNSQKGKFELSPGLEPPAVQELADPEKARLAAPPLMEKRKGFGFPSLLRLKSSLSNSLDVERERAIRQQSERALKQQQSERAIRQQSERALKQQPEQSL